MKHFIFGLVVLSLMPVFSKANETEGSSSAWSVEAGILNLSEESGGSTTTVLPAIGYQLFNRNQIDIAMQVGATAYLDQSTDDTFGILALRINPTYTFTESRWVAEGVLGFQSWEGESLLSADIGLRANYDISTIANDYVSRVFVGVGIIDRKDRVTYLTLGLKKQF